MSLDSKHRALEDVPEIEEIREIAGDAGRPINFQKTVF